MGMQHTKKPGLIKCNCKKCYHFAKSTYDGTPYCKYYHQTHPAKTKCARFAIDDYIDSETDSSSNSQVTKSTAGQNHKSLLVCCAICGKEGRAPLDPNISYEQQRLKKFVCKDCYSKHSHIRPWCKQNQ